MRDDYAECRHHFLSPVAGTAVYVQHLVYTEKGYTHLNIDMQRMQISNTRMHTIIPPTREDDM